MSSELFSTIELAKRARVPRATIQFWIKARMLDAPRIRIRKGRAVRLWSTADVEKAKSLKHTLKRGPKPGSRAKKGKGKS